MATKTFPFQAGVTSYLIPVPLGGYNLEKVEGYVNGNGCFLQIHDATGVAALTSGVSIPLKSVQLFANDGFLWQYANDPLGLPNSPTAGALFANFQNGFLFVLSTTDNVYTAVAGITVDMTVSLEEYEFYSPIAQTVVGDLTTALKSRILWADGAVHSLKKMSVSLAVGATTQYIQIFTSAPTNLVSVPIAQFPIGWTANTAAFPNTPQNTYAPLIWASPGVNALWDYLNFGPNGGFNPLSEDANGTLHTGCYVYASTTSGILTQPAGNDLTIQAAYV